MYTTLDHLEYHIKTQKTAKSPKNFFREIKLLLTIFIVSFVGTLLFTNAQLFFGPKDDSEILDRNAENILADNSIANVVQSNEEKKREIELLISQYEKDFDIVEKSTAPNLEQELKSTIREYDFDFNLLPPMDRLIVPKISLDVPLVNSKYKNEVDFTQGNFDEELTNGVVKYPTTPQPGFEGNTLVFGHTSQEWRQKNPYGTVFSRIPELDQGDEVKLIWRGNLYTYRIVEKIIVVPSKVNSHYQKYQDLGEDYVTLMGCYPLGRTDKRMMITAKLVPNY